MGAVMALNLLTGRSEPGAVVDRNYALVNELIDQFESRFGLTNCQELTGVDLGTEEGRAQFREKNQLANCLDYAEEATRLVLNLVERQEG
jgi:hypothetical protein